MNDNKPSLLEFAKKYGCRTCEETPAKVCYAFGNCYLKINKKQED